MRQYHHIMKRIFAAALGHVFLSLTACRQEKTSLKEITATQININDGIESDAKITEYIKPYKDNIDKQMDSVISYSSYSISKSDGEFNTAIGNMMADAVYEMASPVFKKRTGQQLDAVLLNHGGIRSPLGKGPITMRTAFEIMPFENSIVVVELSGEKIKEMFDYLKRGKAHPISHMQLIIDKNHNIKKATIGGKPIVDTETYFIATNDYLQQGGDGMVFLGDPISLEVLDYKVRSVLIDYFNKHDTIAPVRDDRLIKQ